MLEPVLEVRAAGERVFEPLLSPSALLVLPPDCAVLRGWGLGGPVMLPVRWLWGHASLGTCPLCRALPPPSTCPALCPRGNGALWPLLSAGVHSL